MGWKRREVVGRLALVADGPKRIAEKVRVEWKLVESMEMDVVDCLKDVVKKLKKAERQVRIDLRAVEVTLHACAKMDLPFLGRFI